MASRHVTEMGGEGDSFHTTQWTQFLAAQTQDPNRRRQAEGVILAKYWKPVYAYIRSCRRAKTNEEAKDLTQGFFAEILWGRGLIQLADPEAGSFRGFLKTAVKRYLNDVYRAETARKRMPQAALVSLEGLEGFQAEDLAQTNTPDDAFAYAWASELLAEVLSVVAQRCRRVGQERHWEVFRRTVAEPALTGAPPPSQRQLVEELGLAGTDQVSNMAVTVKRRFAAELRSRIREYVSDEKEVDGEIGQLMQILSSLRARS